MEAKKEKKVCLYCRVSTDMQQGGMESQIRVLKTYCEQNNILNAEFYTDEGISGTKSSRPALDRMMAAVEADEVSSVIVYSFSRFARSTTHLLNALQKFKQKGVHFTSISERIDTNTAIGVASRILHTDSYTMWRLDQWRMEYMEKRLKLPERLCHP
jgi:site-specific DNA recombinase